MNSRLATVLGIFYRVVNKVYSLLFGNRYMLHAPLFEKPGDTLYAAQCHFVDYCLSFGPPLQGKRVLDISCGNGAQTGYILEKYSPLFIYGIDIVPAHIKLAQRNQAKHADGRILFGVDDAQRLTTVKDASFDAVLCFESALHYPQKHEFLKQVRRVLTSDGTVLIADLLTREKRSPQLFNRTICLNSWTLPQYLTEFEKQHIQVTAQPDLSRKLIPSLSMAAKNISRELNSRRTARSMLLRPAAWLAVHLYVYLLRTSFRYHLFVGRIR